MVDCCLGLKRLSWSCDGCETMCVVVACKARMKLSQNKNYAGKRMNTLDLHVKMLLLILEIQ
jgi:hypothetical protein